MIAAETSVVLWNTDGDETVTCSDVRKAARTTTEQPPGSSLVIVLYWLARNLSFHFIRLVQRGRLTRRRSSLDNCISMQDAALQKPKNIFRIHPNISLKRPREWNLSATPVFISAL
jgi:hypothetical protein